MKERVRGSFEIDAVDRLGRAVKTVALIDPSPAAVVRLAASAPERQLRGSAAGGTLVVYPAWDAIHLQVREALGMPPLAESGTDFWVVPEDSEPLSGDWETAGDEPVRDGLRLIAGARKDDPAFLPLLDWFSAAPRPAGGAGPGR